MTEPILLSIPPYPVNKGSVTDEQIKAYMKPFLDRNMPENPGRPQTGMYSDQRKTEYPAIPGKTSIQSVQKPETLSPLGRILLDHIAQKPILGLVKRFKKLGLKTGQGYKIIEELTALGLIKPQTVDGLKLYDLTAKGKDILGQKDPLQGRGGLEHRYWVEQIKTHYLKNEGFTFLEKEDIDLVIETYDQTLAVQVETGKSNLESNLWKLARFKADHKFMIAANPETELKLKELFYSLQVPDKESIQIQTAKSFLKSPPQI